MATVEDAKAEAPFPLTDQDSRILALTDDQFRPTTWDEAKTIIDSHGQEGLSRSPSQLREYIKWSASAAAECGSVTDWLVRHHLPVAWGMSLPFAAPESPTPFAAPADYRVMLNEWPYGWALDLTHMVVWMRTPLPVEADTGTLTRRGWEMVDAFVQRIFVGDLVVRDGVGGDRPEDRVLWWKNAVTRQSVRSLEHFHVLAKDVDKALVEKWTRCEEWHGARHSDKDK